MHFRHLRATLNDGMHFWYPSSDYSLPHAPSPTTKPDNHNTCIHPSPHFKPSAFTYAEWDANASTQRPVSICAIFLEGAPIN